VRAEDDDVMFDGENASLNTLLQLGNQFNIPGFNNVFSGLNQVTGLINQAQGFISNVRSVFGGFF